ncbi:MAG: dockerin type I domain-containing protein [Planctomycetaceae bacterium]|nr:dockerin type I domain-containing protein [Planctomycetaceae bacterium]
MDGDVNADGRVNILDALVMVNALNGFDDGYTSEELDVNGDSRVDVGDAEAVIDAITRAAVGPSLDDGFVSGKDVDALALEFAEGEDPLPWVLVWATGPASEVGMGSGSFNFSRADGGMSPVTVYFTISGSATNGIDYASLPTSITIASGGSNTLSVSPFMDTTIEGIESVVVTITPHPTYTIYMIGSATVDIRDRAGVKKIIATSGVTGIPPGPDAGRDVTGGFLELTQGDVVAFKAIPTDGGDFAPNEPAWLVTGEGATSGETRTVTFGTYRPTGQTVVSVSTPANTAPKEVSMRIVPHPTTITGTTILDSTQIFLPAAYGTIFVHTLVPSAGATGNDLDMHEAMGDLELREYVTYDPPFEEKPPVDLPAPIWFGGFLRDLITTPVGEVFPLNPWSIPSSGGMPMVSPQDFLWKSHAADSLNTGWNEFVTNNDVRVALSTSADGYVVTTTDNGVSFPPGLTHRFVDATA